MQCHDARNVSRRAEAPSRNFAVIKPYAHRAERIDQVGLVNRNIDGSHGTARMSVWRERLVLMPWALSRRRRSTCQRCPEPYRGPGGIATCNCPITYNRCSLAQRGVEPGGSIVVAGMAEIGAQRKQ